MIYFDSNASARKSAGVLNAMLELQSEPLNPSSIHSYGRRARKVIEDARQKVAAAFKVPKHFRIIFTSSATEANNMVLHSIKATGIDVFISETEHQSVLKNGAGKFIPVNENGELNLSAVNSYGFYSVILANNETGVVQPMSDIVAKVRSTNSFIHSDAAQAAGKITFDCSIIGADAYTISSHKCGGPYGVGCLIYNPDVLNLRPLLIGGGQEQGMRAGTENVVAIHGFGVAMEEVHIRNIKMQKDVLPIRSFIEDAVCKQDVIIWGKNAKHRLPNTVSLTMPGVKSELQVAYFDSHGIAVSAGAACSAGRVDYPHVQIAMGADYEQASCTIRVSLGIENTIDEAKFFVQKWHELYNKYKNCDGK